MKPKKAEVYSPLFKAGLIHSRQAPQAGSLGLHKLDAARQQAQSIFRYLVRAFLTRVFVAAP